MEGPLPCRADRKGTDAGGLGSRSTRCKVGRRCEGARCQYLPPDVVFILGMTTVNPAPLSRVHVRCLALSSWDRDALSYC